MGRSPFHIIPSHQVDAAKWDACITNSEAGKIYAQHIYLQQVADNWSGLVMNDYTAVMPVVWRKKWGIRYAYDAPFIQQLGLFGKYNADDLQQAIKTAMQYVQYGDLYFNHTNAIQPFFPASWAATNLVVRLYKSYELISRDYNNHLKSKLKKGATQSLQYIAANNIELAVQTYQQLYAPRFPSVTNKSYQRLITVSKQLINQQQCFVRQVLDNENNLLAISLFLKDENRIYNILPSTTEKGRRLSAMHCLIDKVIKEFSGSSLIFDFEGSDVPGIRAFYESFGAIDEPYFHLHYNHLPIPFSWLKR